MPERDSTSVVDLIKQKSVLKRNVFELAKDQFRVFKTELAELSEKWTQEIADADPRLEVTYKDIGEYYVQLTIAGDVLIFCMHTNVFKFPENSFYWKSSYLKEDPERAYCGIIQVYNFLADSFRFHRSKDIGYLVSRILINKDNHFYVEGKQELAYLFNDFVNSEFNSENRKNVIEAIVKYCIDFDLLVPAYKNIQEITLADASSLKDAISLKTGKRLGFQFSRGGDFTEG